MSEVATLAREKIAQPMPEKPEPSTGTKQLFMLLHGSYGNLFLSKFSTGEKDEQGKDKGIKSAMMVWDSALRQYPADVVQTAAHRVRSDFPEFPPSLPQFEAICKACAPRKTYAQEVGMTALPAPKVMSVGPVSYEVKRDGKDWARKILARDQAGERIRPYTLKCAQQALMTPGARAGLPVDAEV